MADIAALNLKVETSSVEQANVQLKELARTASASERAAQKWGVTTTVAGRSAEDFSKRVQGTIRSLEFERQQLTRNAAAQERHAALRRAGVAASSAEGRAITEAVTALQLQRAANDNAAKASGVQVVAARAAGAAWRTTLSVLGPLTAALTAAAVAQKIWSTAMEVADFGEKADQIGLTVKMMQALQFSAVQNGFSTEQLENAVGKFSQKIGEAAEGSKTMIESLDKIGVKILDVNGNLRPTEDLLFEVAKKIMGIDDPARRAATAVDYFGKAGVKMLPLLAAMAEGQDKLASSAQDAGAIISDEVVGKLDKFADSLQRHGLTMRATLANIAADIIDLGVKIEQWWEKISPNDAASVKKRREAWQLPFEDFFDWLGDAFADIISKAAGWAARFVAEFKEIGPSLKKVFVDAMNGVIDAIESGLNLAQKALSNAKGWFKTQGPVEPVTIGRLDPGQGGTSGVGASAQAETEARVRASMPNSADIRAQQRAAASMMNGTKIDGGPIASKTTVPSVGARQAVATASGSDPYAKAIEGAKEYLSTKKAETEAVGQSVEAASRLKHEQALLNKVMQDGKTISEAQKKEIQDLATQMAEADATLAKAKFMDDMKTKTEDFLTAQQMERDALFLSAEAANRARIEHELLADAKQKGIDQMPGVVEAIKQEAAARAESQEKTRKLTEEVQLAKDVTKGFFTDVKQGLMDGANLWSTLANAAVNALTRISDKLLDMAIDQAFNSIFSGMGGGGFLGGLFGGLFGGGSSGTASGILDGLMGSSFFPTFADGAAFRAGNVIPFAAGGIINQPTMFPMSRGRTGVMGEAGEEGILPLRRRNGRLGVEASGMGGQQSIVRVVVTGDTDLVRVTAQDTFNRSIAVVGPQIEKRAIQKSGDEVVPRVERNKRESLGEWRVK